MDILEGRKIDPTFYPIIYGTADDEDWTDASVIIFTLLETAKANGLNPEAYLNHLLTVLPQRFAADPQAVIDS